MNYEKKYKEALEKARQLCAYPVTKPFICDLQDIFPELKESEDGENKRISKEITQFLKQNNGWNREWLAWLKKQDVVNSYIGKVNDMLSGLEKQGKQKHKFTIGDIISNGSVTYRVDNIVKNCIGQDCYFLVNVESEKNSTRYLTIYDSKGKTHNSEEITWLCEQVDAKFEKQGEQKSIDKADNGEEWIPQAGDTIRKKGTTGPLYMLCKKEGCEFPFVEERKSGIAGGYLSIFTIKEDYELVERPKTIEETLNELLHPLKELSNNYNPTWSEEDEKYIKDLTDYFIGGMSLKHTEENIIAWIKSLGHQPKQEWSEEDEEYLRRAINATKDAYPMTAKWLKSLRPQPKQVWSDEDETGWTNTMIMIKECAANHYTKDSIKLVIDWLKSLKEKYTWKPSEEQMKALYEETQKSDRIKDDRIVSLYNDLKKLRDG